MMDLFLTIGIVILLVSLYVARRDKPKYKLSVINKLKEVAEQGDAGAQYELGTYYYEGKIVEKDLEEAVKWFRMAATQGNARAINKLKELGDDE